MCTVAAAARFAPAGLVVLMDSVHERLASNSNCSAESRADLNTNCAKAQMTMAKHATACDDESNRVWWTGPHSQGLRCAGNLSQRSSAGGWRYPLRIRVVSQKHQAGTEGQSPQQKAELPHVALGLCRGTQARMYSMHHTTQKSTRETAQRARRCRSLRNAGFVSHPPNTRKGYKCEAKQCARGVPYRT